MVGVVKQAREENEENIEKVRNLVTNHVGMSINQMSFEANQWRLNYNNFVLKWGWGGSYSESMKYKREAIEE